MICNWVLENFKSAMQKVTLDFAPLTIFAGANSSGKSTIIQSLLLTAQTLQNSVQSRPVVLNGHILKLGTFSDIVSSGSESSSISIGFRLCPTQETLKDSIPSTSKIFYSPSFVSRLTRALNFVDCKYAFSSPVNVDNMELLQLQPRLEECVLKASINLGEGGPKEEEIIIKRSQKSIENRLSQFQVDINDIQPVDAKSLEYEIQNALPIKRYRFQRRPVRTGKPVGVALQHFLPGKIAIVFDEAEERAKQLVEYFSSLETPWIISERPPIPESIEFKNEFMSILKEYLQEIGNISPDRRISPFTYKKFESLYENLQSDFSDSTITGLLSLPQLIKRNISMRCSGKRMELIKAAKGLTPAEYNIALSPLPDVTEVSVSYTEDFFCRLVKYLGPLRDEPKPVYPLAGATDTKDIGFRGEHTAAVLEINRNTKISYIPSNHMTEGFPPSTPVTESLSRAVLDWLNYMGMASQVETLDKGKLGHELKVATGDSSLHDLTHVGVGVSQVLPILVISLLAPPGSTLIFEQPELHLHPRVQTRLADFFVSLIRVKKQCIVETHSKYLIDRLRYQSVVSENEDLSKDVIIYFTEKEYGHSSYRPIKINRYGVIEQWPKGFFDENEEIAASILRASAKKRKMEAKKNA